MELILGSLVSFSIFHYTSHPKSRIHKKLPSKRLFNFQFTPHVNFAFRDRVIHMHHWVIFSPVLIVAQNADKGFLSAGLIKGLLLGSIIQGLMYRDRFKFIFKQQDYRKIRDSHYNVKSLVRLRFWK